jgi:site-specific recombinase XerD
VSSATSTTHIEENAAIGEQLRLFDPGINLAEIRVAREQVLSYSQAHNTVRGYRSSWRTFAHWCEEAGRQAAPASEDTVSLFVTWAATCAAKKRKPGPYKLRHVRHICAAIADRHRMLHLPSPVTDIVRATLAGIARSTDQISGAKEAVSPQQLRSAIQVQKQSALEIRDQAILLVGFAAGWRSAELAGLYFREVSIFEAHMRLWLRRSKTDQLGQGREVRIPRVAESPLCPVAALEAWIAVRGREHGPLFLPFRGRNPHPENRPCQPDLICHVVKRALKKAGIDPARYGAHSLPSVSANEPDTSASKRSWAMCARAAASIAIRSPACSEAEDANCN